MQQPIASTSTLPASAPQTKRTHKQRYNRSRAGCLTCRGRKIKCDQTHPCCKRCTEFSAACRWPETSTASSSRQSSIDRSTQFTAPTPTSYDVEQSTIRSSGMIFPERYGGIYGQDYIPTAGIGVGTGTNGQSGSALEQNRQSGSGQADNDPGALFHSMDTGTMTAVAGGRSDDAWSFSSTATATLTHIDPDLTFSNLFEPFSAPAQLAPFPSAPTHPPSTGPDLALQASTLASRRRHIKQQPNTALVPPLARFNPYIPPPNPPLPSEPIECIFPSADSKRLFHHVRSRTSSIIIPHNGQRDLQNPYMTLALSLILRNEDTSAQTAFRHSLLSLGAAHAHYDARQASAEQKGQMMVRTTKSRKKAMMFLEISSVKDKGDQLDLVLVTCLTLFIRNNLFADLKWKECLDFAIRAIVRQGGPVGVLENQQDGCRRFLVEQIATADLFSTFTTGEEPLLLGQSPSWWDMSQDQRQKGSDWEGFERHLGVSREMMNMLAKSRIMITQKYRQVSDAWKENDTAKLAAQAVREEAERMIRDLEGRSAEQSNSPSTKRVMRGNLAYKYMIIISLSTEILLVAPTDTKVQTAVRSTLELCSEMSHEPVNLIWPLLVAGSCAKSEGDRAWISQLFNSFGLSHCRDLEVAEVLVKEQWTRIDCGLGMTPWHKLMAELGHVVCLIHSGTLLMIRYRTLSLLCPAASASVSASESEKICGSRIPPRFRFKLDSSPHFYIYIPGHAVPISESQLLLGASFNSTFLKVDKVFQDMACELLQQPKNTTTVYDGSQDSEQYVPSAGISHYLSDVPEFQLVIRYKICRLQDELFKVSPQQRRQIRADIVLLQTSLTDGPEEALVRAQRCWQDNPIPRLPMS